ncbi:DUF2550 domain-containing protein [Nocardia huaxiensis]|uniref:DUF2550 domain-containing protein n=1 Tax=Nocardia huaxiensis TaxID=2755382 RepID=A0A7D6Z3R5_9NOCA|nr:DUF2550 domain-containing protein [Nocardia huaxiensis]QLY32146.1 DUF2550 domain-containing protein [Nocardia huaxiensis]UFS95728.1 DUF2550 domain-containing protein [Nocardia huaxiensis]
MVVLIILVLLLVALALASIYRLVMLRRGGTAALLRVLPARGHGGGWRHGLIRYDEDTLVFYKLSSLKLGPDSTMRRLAIEVGNRRSPQDDEYDIMTDESIVTLSDGHGSYEVALDRGALAALLSWVESRPSERIRRRPNY